MNQLADKIVEIISDNAADSIVVTDKEGVIQFVNKAFTTITGYSAEEAVGETPRILKSGEHDVHFYTELWKDILSGRKVRVTFINKRKCGELYYHEEIITPVVEGDDVTGFVSCGRDITSLVKKSEELEEYVSFIDTVFETMSSQVAAYKLMKDMRYKK